MKSVRMLLVAAVLLMIVAPAALADGCPWSCKFSFDIEYCDNTNPRIGNMATCDDVQQCIWCGPGVLCCDYHCRGSNCYDV